VKKQPSSELGERLHRVRLALGLKQNEMAGASGLSPGYFSEIISGKKDNPGIENVLKIATRFNISLNYLLLGEGEMFLPDKEEILKKDKELNLYIETIDDLNRVMKRSNFLKNLILSYGIKACIDNEDTIRKEIEKLIEKEEKKAG
jgi:transcriptional regulator with XRE-family HTH domain